MARSSRMATPAEVRAANRLRRAREAAGISREELLRRCRNDPEDPVSWTTTYPLAAIEKAQTSYPWHYAPVFARALDVSLGDLLWASPR